MLSTVQTKFLAKHLQVVPKETTDAIDALKKTYPDAVITPCRADPTLLRIEGKPHDTVADSVQGGLDIHPNTLNGMDPARQKKLMDGLHDPTKRAATIEDFQSSGNERWRFDDTYQTTVAELQKVPGKLDNLQPILDNASPGGKNRLAQIQISHGSPEEMAINTRGVELALQMGASDCYEVVAYVEFFYALLEDERRRLKKVVNTEEAKRVKELRAKGQKVADTSTDDKKLLVNAKLLDHMGKDTLKQERLDEARLKIDQYKTAMTPYCGGATIIGALDGADAGTAKGLLEGAAGGLNFTDTANGGYHLFKHFTKMYKKLHDGDLPKQALHYTTEARAAVAKSDSWSNSVGQTGSTSHQFNKGTFKTYVPVSGTKASLASFF
jgi:hypothetical protein